MKDPHRVGEQQRKTRETEIAVRVDLDGTGAAEIDSGVPFFDHMLDQLARHGLFDLTAGGAARRRESGHDGPTGAAVQRLHRGR